MERMQPKQVEAAKKAERYDDALMHGVETIVPSNPLASIAGVPKARHSNIRLARRTCCT